MQDQPKTMQQLADELHSIIVQEIYPDGLRVSAIPISSLLPKPILTNDGFTWQIQPRKVNITPRILIRELSQMNPQVAIFPRLFGLHAAEALQSLKQIQHA